MDPVQIEHHRVIAFGRNLAMAPQTGEFKLQNAVECDLNFTEPGKYFTDEIIGKSDPQEMTDRYGPTPSKEPNRGRRIGVFTPLEDANWLGDNIDKVRQQVTDPANAIVTAMRFGQYRARDQKILTSLYAPAREGETGETVVPFPAGNVLTNSGKLTLAKLRSASLFHDNGKVLGEERFWVGGASDKSKLLEEDKVTSAEYAAIKALVNGEIDTFMGFKFIWFADDEIPIVGGKRRNISFKKTGNQYKSRPIVGGETAKVWTRTDRKGNWEAYLNFDHGFLRRHDASVCVHDCDDT
ncbi:MAG: hypothetical protein BroJett013_30510 [Alphaproteobacteria bacterium]|nr:MAG: hypothetical protein BroJett013_30510 [Alphaproteobacteria bacterium]